MKSLKNLLKKRLKSTLLKIKELKRSTTISLYLGEIAEVCRSLPNGKASGLDGIQYEHFKYAGEDCWKLFTKIMNFIRKHEQLSESATVGVILSLFKGKKKRKLCKESYRGITLLKVVFHTKNVFSYLTIFQSYLS